MFTIQLDGTYSFDPGDDFNGLGLGETAVTSITYQISDGEGGFDTATVTVTVTGANDGPIPVDPSRPPIDPNNPPTGVPFDPQSPFEPPLDPNNYIPQQAGTEASAVTPFDLTPYFGDPDTNGVVSLSVDPADLPNGMSFDPATGIISGTPDSDASTMGDAGNPGTYTIAVTATDDQGETFVTNLTYVITNPPPVVTTPIEDFQHTVGEDFTTQVADNFNDPDGDTLTYTATGLPAGLTIDPATGEISGQLDPAAVIDAPNGDGIYTVTVTVDDGQGGTVTSTFRFVALDAFTPENETPDGPAVPRSQPQAANDNITEDPILLSALKDIHERMSQMGEVNEIGGGRDNYWRGYGKSMTGDAGTILRTMVIQDRLYLEIISNRGLDGWEVRDEQGRPDANWIGNNSANLFARLQIAGDGMETIYLTHKQSGLTIEAIVHMKSGVLEIVQDAPLEKLTTLPGFSRQVSGLLNTQTQEAANLIRQLN